MSFDMEPETKPKASGLKFRHILILLLLAFAGGVILTGYLVKHYSFFGADPAPVVAAEPVPAIADNIPAQSAANTATVDPSPMAAQVDNLQNKLSQINADANAASGNAVRAEGMLVAVSVRRAIDSGTPLGFSEDQLVTRFGGEQAQAVNTIRNAAAHPITLDMLQSELDGLGPQLTDNDANAGLWQKIQHELATLFVLRKEGSPSSAPEQRFARAKAQAGTGNISGALALVETMPGAVHAQNWIGRAKQYLSTHAALDSIEHAALATPAAIAPAPVAAAPAAAASAPSSTSAPASTPSTNPANATDQ